MLSRHLRVSAWLCTRGLSQWDCYLESFSNLFSSHVYRNNLVFFSLFFFFFLLFNNPDKFRTVTLTRPRLRSLNFYESSISFQKVSSNKIVQLYKPFTRFEIEIIFPRMSLKRAREKIFNSIEREKWTKLRMNQKKRSSGLEEKKKKKKNKSKWNYKRQPRRVLTSRDQSWCLIPKG